MIENDIAYMIALIQAVCMRYIQVGRLTPEEKLKVLDVVTSLIRKNAGLLAQSAEEHA